MTIGLTRDQLNAYKLAWGQRLSDERIADAISEVSDPDRPWSQRRVKALRLALGDLRKTARTPGRRPMVKKSHQLMPVETYDRARLLAWAAPDKVPPRRFPI